jgi:hypothetical protein
MKVTKSDRGFEFLNHDAYIPADRGKYDRLASQSSAVGEYDDAYDRPGSSALWIGEHHHLNREEVAQLVKHLKAWLKTGTLSL